MGTTDISDKTYIEQIRFKFTSEMLIEKCVP